MTSDVVQFCDEIHECSDHPHPDSSWCREESTRFIWTVSPRGNLIVSPPYPNDILVFGPVEWGRPKAGDSHEGVTP